VKKQPHPHKIYTQLYGWSKRRIELNLSNLDCFREGTTTIRNSRDATQCNCFVVPSRFTPMELKSGGPREEEGSSGQKDKRMGDGSDGTVAVPRTYYVADGGEGDDEGDLKSEDERNRTT
jgi:hypothetical protein